MATTLVLLYIAFPLIPKSKAKLAVYKSSYNAFVGWALVWPNPFNYIYIALVCRGSEGSPIRIESDPSYFSHFVENRFWAKAIGQ